MADYRNIGALARKSRVIDLPDGTHAELRALVLTDWATIQEEAAHALKKDLIETYARNVEHLPAKLREQAVMDAFKRAEGITANTISSDDVLKFMGTIRGQLLSLWLSMRGGLPGLTYDEAAIIWSVDQAKVREAADAVGDLSRATLGNAQPPRQAGAQDIPATSQQAT